MKLADRLYVFCSDSEKGIEFIIQELPSSVAKNFGTLQVGEFLTSKYTTIEWDEKVNGDIENKNCIGLERSERIEVVDDDYTATTIILSNSDFVDLLKQIKNPRTHSYNDYKIFKLKTPISKIEFGKKNNKK